MSNDEYVSPHQWVMDPLKESDLDMCSNCDHPRGLHVEWPSGWTCGGDDVTVEGCDCDHFHEPEKP